jgi:hypothetical protein
MRRILVVTAVILGMAVMGGCAMGKKHSAGASAAPVRPNPRPRPALWPANSPANALANAVMNASGAPRWDMVRVVGFRYVEREGERVVANRRHLWDVAGGVDTVYLPEGAVSVNVLSPDTNDPAQAAAMRAFLSDTQFLAAMRIGANSGVTLEYGGSATVNGKALEILRLSNLPGNPGWRQQWYVDPLTGLVMYCDEAPESDPEARRRVTWESYRNFGPFRPPTLHRFVGDVRSIAIEDLRVEW